jgi:hypothetical protein
MGIYHCLCGYPQALSTMGMNNTRVIRSLTSCWRSNTDGPQHRPYGGCWTYRHRMVSNNPLIMKANATA